MILNLYRNDDINFLEEEISFFSTIPLLTNSKFLGYTKDCTNSDNGPIGYESDDGNYYIPVFILNFADYTVSDEPEEEQKAIDNGKNCVIFIHGKDSESYIMRFTSKELKLIDLSFFDEKDVYESYFYRS